MTARIKICGLKTVEAVQAANAADYMGFVFYYRSSRHISIEHAAKLKPHITSAKTVAVTVDAKESTLQEIVSGFKPDFLQLHGKETPERVRKIKSIYGVGIIKAIKVFTESDLEHAGAYADSVDFFLFDTKLPGGLPGGNGVSFDWNILQGKTFAKPYFISGGISVENVEEALRLSGAPMVDISSGVESSPGNKDPKMIADFIQSVQGIT